METNRDLVKINLETKNTKKYLIVKQKYYSEYIIEK